MILRSVGIDAPPLTSIQIVYPRFIHSELMTHRVFSRNAASSRAVPVRRVIADLREQIALPSQWRMEERGMQGFTEAPYAAGVRAEVIYRRAMEAAIREAEELANLGMHKQHINRLLEPFAHMTTLITSTQWNNWFALRDHPDADPTIAELARVMKDAIDAVEPTLLGSGEWHLPYVTGDDEAIASCIEYANSASVLELDKLHIRSDDRKLTAMEVMKRVSAARCARTSYKSFKTGKASTVSEDFDLFSKLVTADLIHASPTEHQATPDRFLVTNRRWMTPAKHGNFNGWIQHRKELPNENLDTVIGLAA